MNTISKLAAIGALVACTGLAGASNGAPITTAACELGSLGVNPQPLPPERPSRPSVADLWRAAPASVVAINPQPLPPRDPNPT
jgi:hypothetical protein